MNVQPFAINLISRLGPSFIDLVYTGILILVIENLCTNPIPATWWIWGGSLNVPSNFLITHSGDLKKSKSEKSELFSPQLQYSSPQRWVIAILN